MTTRAANATCDVAIVGGGVVGCAVAYALAREGRSVRLFERERVAGEASGAAAGMLAPLAEDHLARAGATGVAGEASPLQRAAFESLRAFPSLCEELRALGGVDPQWLPSGLLRVALDEAARESLRRSAVGAFDDAGIEWLDARDAHDLEPDLAPEIEGALWSPREGNVRSPELTRAYAASARALGAVISEGTPVVEFLTRGRRVEGVRTPAGVTHAVDTVLCAGAWSGGSAPGPAVPLGRAWPQGLPIEPIRGQILSLHGSEPTPAVLRSPRPIVWGPGAYIVPKSDGSRVVGATMERVGFVKGTTASGIRELLDAAPRLLPHLAGARLLSTWAGLRPGSPDGLPLVGRVAEREGLILATGHHRNGVLLSWLTAGWVAALVSGKALPPAANACEPERFAAPRPASNRGSPTRAC